MVPSVVREPSQKTITAALTRDPELSRDGAVLILCTWDEVVTSDVHRTKLGPRTKG